MLNVISIKAPRPAVDWYSTSEVVERAPSDPLLPADRVSLSPEARGQLRRDAARPGDGGRPAAAGGKAASAGPQGGASQLTPEQQREVQELQQRDAHVRAHESAHQAAGGDLTGPASFSYQLGPDGRNYAVGGEVPVQSRAGRTPDETIAIARRVRAAALAPSDPSAADLAAAASASQVELRAMQQKRQLGQQGQEAGRTGQASQPGARARAGGPERAAGPSAAPASPGVTPGSPSPAAAAIAAAPISTPQANLERLIVRAPEEASPF